MINKQLHLTVFGLMILMLTNVNATDISRGKYLSKSCVSCHGINGNSPSDAFPKIAGQHASYLLKQLMDFKTKKRNHDLMSGIVAPLSKQDLTDLAAFYANQTPQANVAKKDPELIALAEKLYRGGNEKTGISACSACHSPDGKGIASAKFPALSFQHAAYTKTQLKAFRQASLNEKFSDNIKSARENDIDAIMRQVSKNLTDKEINALSEYIAGLH